MRNISKILASGLLMGALSLPAQAQDNTSGTSMTAGTMSSLSASDQTTLQRALGTLPLSQQVSVLKAIMTMTDVQRGQLLTTLNAGGTLSVDATGVAMMRDASGTMMPLPTGSSMGMRPPAMMPMGGMPMGTTPMAGMPMGTTPMGTMPMAGMMAIEPMDQVFLVKATAGNMAEVAHGQIAQRKARSKSVRDLAAFVVKEHGMAQSEIVPIAQAKGMMPPMMLDIVNQTLAEKLSKLSGNAFDKAYMASQIEAHENAIALYQSYLAMGTDPQAKAYAAKYLPRIIGHTNMIYQVAREVGAPGIEKRPQMLPGGASMSEMMNGMMGTTTMGAM